MIDYQEKNGALTFRVIVVPRAARSGIVGEHNRALRVRLAAAPVNGAANAELVRILARAFAVPRSAVEIRAGHTGKLKTIRIAGGQIRVLHSLEQAELPTRSS